MLVVFPDFLEIEQMRLTEDLKRLLLEGVILFRPDEFLISPSPQEISD